jgi:hypothetical protein
MRAAIYSTLPALATAGAFADSLQHIKNALVKAQQETVDLKHGEEVAHTKFMQFCADTIEEKTTDIEELNADIQEHTANGEKAAADALNMEEQSDNEATKAATAKAELKEITETRQTEATAYADVKADLEMAIAQTQEAHELLHSQHEQRHYQASDAAFMQVEKIASNLRFLSASSLSSSALSQLSTYINEVRAKKQAPTGDSVAYESGMGGGFNAVLQLLEDLKTKFNEELSAATQTERAAKDEFNKVSTQYNKLIQQAEHNTETFKQKAGEKRALSGDELKQAKEKASLVEKYQAVLDTTKKQKAEQERFFEERQAAMQKDLNAFEQALDVIADLMSPEALMQASASSLLQVQRRLFGSNDDRVHKAKEFLAQSAGKLKSKLLLQVVAKEDVFAKVKELIQSLITRLTNEAAEEADDKAYCDAELKREGAAKEEKEANVEKLETDLQKCGTDILNAANSIDTLANSIEQSTKQLTEATAQRAAQKTELAAQIKELAEMKEGMETAKDALAVALEGASFSQTSKSSIRHKVHKQPLTTGAYESKAGGILNMVEMLISNVSVEKAKLESEEVTSKREFQELETRLKVDLASAQTSLEHMKTKKSELEQQKGNLQNELETAKEMVEAQLRIWEGLQKKCVHAASFEERVAQREAEIASLQEAMKILQGEE